ncbi:MAG: DNA-3-methyladenine glycosylase 2 family protein [Chloroflexi bacterium]|nr:DNA-3-methyladenine glycosylase 2 family protein [Chloroflexota bacterium]
METIIKPEVQANHLRYNSATFSLDDTLASGQCFRWKRQRDGWWHGVVGRSIVAIKQEGELFTWWTFPEPGNATLISDYFQLDVDLAEIVRRITDACPSAGEAAARWSGLRLVRQDPEECILSFVCSTANSVPRIAYSISRFSKEYGEPLGEVDGETYYSFPTAQALAKADPAHLTKLSSLGFRGRNLVRVAQQIEERGPGWADSLREMPYDQAHKELVGIHGIGAKIADCVCLFSLDKTEAVPVDTHVWQLARALYFPDWTERKSITSATYNMVRQAFIDRFGELAGYAQNFLFYDHFSKHWGGVSPLLKGMRGEE